MEAWRTQCRALAGLANLIEIKATRCRSGNFVLVFERSVIREFQSAYAPTRSVHPHSRTLPASRADAFALAVDRALLGKVGRPWLTREDRGERLRPEYGIDERHKRRLRKTDRIDAQRLMAKKGTILAPR